MSTLVFGFFSSYIYMLIKNSSAQVCETVELKSFFSAATQSRQLARCEQCNFTHPYRSVVLGQRLHGDTCH